MEFVEQDERKVKSNFKSARQILLDNDAGFYWMTDPTSKFSVYVDDKMSKDIIVQKVFFVQNLNLPELLGDYNGYRMRDGLSRIEWGTISQNALFLFLDEMVCSMCMKSTMECGNSIGCSQCTSWFHVHCVINPGEKYACNMCLLKKELRDNNDDDDDA